MRPEHIEFLTNIERRLTELSDASNEDARTIYCIVTAGAVIDRTKGDWYRIDLRLEGWPETSGTRCIIQKVGDRYDLSGFHEAFRAEFGRLVSKIKDLNAAKSQDQKRD